MKNWIMGLKNNMLRKLKSNHLHWMIIVVFLGCMLILAWNGKTEALLSITALLIGVISTPFFNKNIELEKYREQLAYEKKYEALTKYYDFIGEFYIKSLKMTKFIEKYFNNKQSIDATRYLVSQEINAFSLFVKKNYDELTGYCSLQILEQPIKMSGTNVVIFSGINKFIEILNKINKKGINKSNIKELQQAEEFISSAYTGARKEIRQALRLEEDYNIRAEQYTKLFDEIIKK